MGIPNPHPRSLAPGERLAVENPPHFSRVERILWNEASVGMIPSFLNGELFYLSFLYGRASSPFCFVFFI